MAIHHRNSRTKEFTSGKYEHKWKCVTDFMSSAAVRVRVYVCAHRDDVERVEAICALPIFDFMFIWIFSFVLKYSMGRPTLITCWLCVDDCLFCLLFNTIWRTSMDPEPNQKITFRNGWMTAECNTFFCFCFLVEFLFCWCNGIRPLNVECVEALVSISKHFWFFFFIFKFQQPNDVVVVPLVLNYYFYFIFCRKLDGAYTQKWWFLFIRRGHCLVLSFESIRFRTLNLCVSLVVGDRKNHKIMKFHIVRRW